MENKQETDSQYGGDRKSATRLILFATSGVVLFLGACGGGGGSNIAATEVSASAIGTTIAGASATEVASFTDGLASFTKTEAAADGLGPVFNATSCGKCHAAGAAGGAGDDLSVAIVRRIGGIENGVYSDMVDKGGPVLQSHSLQDFDKTYPIAPEVVPAGAQYVSKRLTTPLFGAGLIEAIPDAEILTRSGFSQGLGIKGHANMVTNILTGASEVGRFGWKCQLSNLQVFSADAYLNEMGITNSIFPNENLPQGQPIPSTVSLGNEPNDGDGDVPKFATYMRLLAPPASDPKVFAESTGGKLFASVGCVKCHVPSMTTGNNSSPALAYKVARLYSDLLVHDMGDGLADGVVQGQASGSEFRTAPLWGLSKRRFYLHNASASTIEDAILAHGGEATQVRQNYLRLSNSDQNELLKFLGQL